MAVGDLVEIVASGQLNGSGIQNTFHYRVLTEAVGMSTVLSLVMGVHTNLLPKFMAVQSNEMVWEQVVGNKIWPLPRTIQEYVVFSEPGLIVSPAIPAASAVVVTKQTALAGVRYRGRNYIAGTPVDDMTNGMYTQFASVAMHTLFDALSTNLAGGVVGGATAATAKPVIYHRPAAWNAGVASSTDIVACYSTTIYRQQRRRETYVGV